MILIIGILLIIILLIITWKLIKPYTIKYDHTYFITGGNGSGKTLTCVKIAVVQIRKVRFQWNLGRIKAKILNFFINKNNKKVIKLTKKGKKTKKHIKETYNIPAKPQLYSNMPIYFKPHFWSKKREWCCMLEKEHLLLYKELAQNSIIVIDDITQMINQYNWDIEEVCNNVGEFMSLHRHYYNSYVFANSQAVQEVVAQIRRKANIATWCFNFRCGIWPFHKLYYKMSCNDLMINDSVGNTMQSQIEENTKTFYGFFPAKNTYDSRYLRHRLDNILYKYNTNKENRFDELTTNSFMRFNDYISPLDNGLTDLEKQEMLKKALKDSDRRNRRKKAK